MPKTELRVRDRQCASCVYRTFPAEELARLEDKVRDPHVGFSGWRACHKTWGTDDGVVCRGFYDRHGDECTPIQIEVRLGLVREVA